MSCSEIVKNIKIIKIIIWNEFNKLKEKIRKILENEFYASFNGAVPA